MFKIISIRYELAEDDLSEVLGDAVRCQVPFDKGMEFVSAEEALKYAAKRLGYDIPFVKWGALRPHRGILDEVDATDGKTVRLYEYVVDFNVDNQFRQIKPEDFQVGSDNWRKWENKEIDLYDMNIFVCLISKDIEVVRFT